jgi:threonine/homoserine/homoserine lactone efflux protein
MIITFYEIGLYLLALALLFITPGPVWVALIARNLKHGFSGAWPLALGVAIGDVIWPVLALLTLGQLVAAHAALLTGLKYVAVIVFMVMGGGLIMARVDRLQAPDQLTKAGFLPGFVAGLLVIVGNPKAILFYIGVLPGFFDVTRVTTLDIAFVGLVSAAVPFCGNIILAVMLDRASLLIASKSARRRLNVVTGVVLFIVAGLILIM